jgi:hypothetical protein
VFNSSRKGPINIFPKDMDILKLKLKVKVKLSLCLLTEHHAMKRIGGVEV